MAKSKKRFIDNEVVKEKIAQAHMLQLDLLLEKLEEGLIEPQEMKLLWDMVRAHGIGMDNVDDKVQAALEARENSLAALDLDLGIDE